MCLAYHTTDCWQCSGNMWCMLIVEVCLTSLGNSGLCWTVFARNRDTAVPAEGNGDLQTLICVLVARPRRCLTLSNLVPRQYWMASYLSYTLRMKTLFRGWPIMVNDTHTRRRRSLPAVFIKCTLSHEMHTRRRRRLTVNVMLWFQSVFVSFKLYL